MKGYGIENEAQLNVERSKNEYNALQIQQYTANLDSIKVELEAEAERVKGAATIFDGQARMYAAELEAESARVAGEQRGLELEIASERAGVDLQLQKANLNIAQTQREAALSLEAISAAGRTAAQLAGSAMAAVNIGASLSTSSSTSDGTSCSTSYSYSGSI